MAEETSDSENPGDSIRKYPPFPTTPEAEVAKDAGEVATYTVGNQSSDHRSPNVCLLVLSWGVFAIGLYFLYTAAMGFYKQNIIEAKLTFTALLGILTIPAGMFLRKAAHHGFRAAFTYVMEGMSKNVG